MLTVARLGFDGTWRGTDQRRQLDLNKPPIAGHTTLYTPAWGPSTPPESGIVAAVIGTLPATTPNNVLTGVVTQSAGGGGIAIPPGGAVLVARGNQAPHLSAEAPVGTTVAIRLTLTPGWGSMAGAIGGGPVLVADGTPVFRANESFGDPVLNARTARSAVGQLADGRILLVTAEGGSLGYSAGMTNYELAVALARLGAVTAMSLGTGPSAAMAFDGSLLTRPPGTGEQALSDALLISDYGYGAATPAILSSIRAKGGLRGIPVTLDSRFRMLEYSGVTAATPNEPEVEAALGVRVGQDWEKLVSAAEQLRARMKLESLVITRGRDGMAAFTDRHKPVDIPIFGSDEVADVTGAGDTVIATFTAALAAGATTEEAAQLANYAGGIVVMKRGTATVTRQELLHAIDSAPPTTRPH